MSRRFERRVSLITGSSRGIGRALALTLAREGAAVVVNYVRNAELASQTVREIEALGSRAVAVQANMETADEIETPLRPRRSGVRFSRSFRLKCRRKRLQENRRSQSA